MEERWSEYQTAFAVCRYGTVSAAATALGIHRGTVMRHIDSLEESIGVRLFQRHARGYTPTEAGRDLERVLGVTDEQLAQFVERARGRETDVTGEVIVTSVEIMSPMVARGIARFQAEHPKTRVQYIATGRPLDLSYGQAHVAIRVGKKPDRPEYVVRPYFKMRTTFYAHHLYVKRHGLPKNEADFRNHFFVCHEDPSRTPFFTWLDSVVAEENIVLRSTNQRALIESTLAGVGIGFMPIAEAAAREELVQVMPPRPDWVVPLWLVTHVDLHLTSKVRAISKALLVEAREAEAAEVEGVPDAHS